MANGNVNIAEIELAFARMKRFKVLILVASCLPYKIDNIIIINYYTFF